MDDTTKTLPDTDAAAALPDGEPRAEAIDWEKRCEEAERALADSLSFAGLYAKEGGEMSEGLMDSEVYQRFVALRGMGLSVKEAFYAADSAREKSRPLPDATKGHLVSSHTRVQAKDTYLSSEELSMMKELLGEDYSSEDILKLYRRVAKA